MSVAIRKTDITKAMVDNLSLTREAATQAGYDADDFDLSAFMAAQASGYLSYYEVVTEGELIGHAITMLAPNHLLKSKEMVLSVWNFYVKPEQSVAAKLSAVRLLRDEAKKLGCKSISIQEGKKVHRMEVKHG